LAFLGSFFGLKIKVKFHVYSVLRIFKVWVPFAKFIFFAATGLPGFSLPGFKIRCPLASTPRQNKKVV
jgi:hypothetical protein